MLDVLRVVSEDVVDDFTALVHNRHPADARLARALLVWQQHAFDVDSDGFTILHEIKTRCGLLCATLISRVARLILMLLASGCRCHDVASAVSTALDLLSGDRVDNHVVDLLVTEAVGDGVVLCHRMLASRVKIAARAGDYLSAALG